MLAVPNHTGICSLHARAVRTGVQSGGGVKDATADITRVSSQRLLMGPNFIQLSGEDATALALMAHGGHGW